MTDFSKLALDLYKPPFRYYRGYIWDSGNKMVADDPATDAPCRIRGGFVI